MKETYDKCISFIDMIFPIAILLVVMVPWLVGLAVIIDWIL